MKTLAMDIETYSSTDLKKTGVYKYVESPDFEILLFGYSVDGGQVQVVDFIAGEKLPEEIIKALTDPGVTKWAFNSQFERICLSRWLGLQYLDPRQWRCTMVWSAYIGLPLSLEGVGAVLGLEKRKLTEGKDLIRYFCTPCKPTIANGKRTRNLPIHDPVKWEQFKAYNRRDVEVEIAIQERLFSFPVPENIWDEFHLDQEINDRGVALDMTLVKAAIKADERTRSELLGRMGELTDLDNPNSVQQLKEWLADHGLETDTLGKKAVAELLETAAKPIDEVLSLRQQLAKSSVKKYQAMESVVCSDKRTRGIFQFYGANRTGRWSGRLLQPQNLVRNNMPDLTQARSLVRSGNFTALEMLYDSVPEVLSQLIRTAFIPKPGYKFIVADFSSIERVVLAWLAGEQWVLDAYAAKKDLYIATASQMFGVPITDKKDPLRQKGKIADLACGYGGSVGALKAMGALEMGLTEGELKPLVDAWRAANPNIVSFWWDVDRAALTAVRERTTTETHGIRFAYQSGMLFITLPSGRRLAYVKPRIGTNRFGSDSVTYEGIGAAKKWERLETYGAKIVENIIQAISRDLLCNAMQGLRHLPIVMHIHDEIVIEAEQQMSVRTVCEQMSQIPPWAKGLLLRAEGFECDFYQKD
ncbi:DNA polymerase [Desulfitobacterium hafniense]|uniref:DNA-directed DNA polymerase n=1 Tax=Desulfitobacterium hafniense TaxID=49338 RepID=A0A098B522_DESHA|nr:DNA polymerase [Desulfitobacterium hafniense]CDX03457.1 DNA polymerase [Desulfitobacterium hafniense]